MSPNAVTCAIVDAAYKVHTTLGPGLFEAVYESAMAIELEDKGVPFTRQQPIEAIYKNVLISPAFRADLIVDDQIIVELKSVEFVSPTHKKQLLTYLRLADKPLGLILNFNVYLLKHGITRIANQLEP